MSYLVFAHCILGTYRAIVESGNRTDQKRDKKMKQHVIPFHRMQTPLPFKVPSACMDCMVSPLRDWNKLCHELLVVVFI